ncbi:uncharacterized protein LOC131956159 [Physella acuta]|uniref:uncharacterized protein LOC131956159 n=1 Tax=Physella acuta TaxID=109671 RepID=UPI0027DCA92A|nr:uncharacterized protein LOC131956159 [Physella acuta]
MTTINVTRENFQKDVTSALIKCAENVKVLVPWVHCEWSKKTLEIIDKLPKSGFTDQKSLFHQTDVEAKAQGYTKYSYQKLGKVLNLLHYWGNGLYLWHQRKSLCATDLMTYESLLVKFLTTTPPDKVRVTSIGHSVPCWKVNSFEAFIQAEKLHGEALKAADIFKRQGLLIKLSPLLFEKSQDGDSVYVRMSDIPESHSMLQSLWPEPCPQQRIIQTNRCYNFLPTIPDGFMSKLLRSVLKVFQPLCIWRTGFLIRQGPVDIRASLHRYKGDARLDKTPVLVVSARAVDIRQKKSSSIIDSSQEARSTMFAALRQVLLVVDSVVQKMKLYGFVTLVCPECSESNTEKMIDVTKTWHLPYYIGLISSRHKHCKSHPKIDHNYLCEPQTEQGGWSQFFLVHS